MCGLKKVIENMETLTRMEIMYVLCLAYTEGDAARAGDLFRSKPGVGEIDLILTIERLEMKKILPLDLTRGEK